MYRGSLFVSNMGGTIEGTFLLLRGSGVAAGANREAKGVSGIKPFFQQHRLIRDRA